MDDSENKLEHFDTDESENKLECFDTGKQKIS